MTGDGDVYTTKDHQTRLAELGFNPGPVDGVLGGRTRTATKEFQRSRGLIADGIIGPKTEAALFAPGALPAQPAPPLSPVPSPVLAATDPTFALDPAWMPTAKMKGIVVHWTGGPNKATSLDRAHYHVIIDGDGTLVRGAKPITANESPVKAGQYAAHTLGCNSGFIGVSLAGMLNAVESPFDPGDAPLTRTQWDKLPLVLADLCRRYGIPVTKQTVLSHAEVQDTLQIKQRGKWDIARLPFDLSVKGAHACGDIFRSRTAALLHASTNRVV